MLTQHLDALCSIDAYRASVVAKSLNKFCILYVVIILSTFKKMRFYITITNKKTHSEGQNCYDSYVMKKDF